MSDGDWLADRFEQNRPHLRAVAYRMLGSAAEADDAVQEAWLRLSRSGADGVQNLAGWLTTTVARVCLDVLRARKARREAPLPAWSPEQEAVGAKPPQRYPRFLARIFAGEAPVVMGPSRAAPPTRRPNASSAGRCDTRAGDKASSRLTGQASRP